MYLRARFVISATCGLLPSRYWSNCDDYSLAPSFPIKNDSVVHHADQSGEYFTVVYDSRTKGAKYVVERLLKHAGDQKIDTKKRPAFYAEPSIEIDSFKVAHANSFFLFLTFAQIHPKDYTDSVYDRGHMVPSADFHHSKELNKATFSMANVCPQVLLLEYYLLSLTSIHDQAPGLNKGFWSRFEAWLRHLLATDQFEVCIISPLTLLTLRIDRLCVLVARAGSGGVHGPSVRSAVHRRRVGAHQPHHRGLPKAGARAHALLQSGGGQEEEQRWEQQWRQSFGSCRQKR